MTLSDSIEALQRGTGDNVRYRGVIRRTCWLPAYNVKVMDGDALAVCLPDGTVQMDGPAQPHAYRLHAYDAIADDWTVVRHVR